MALHPLDPLTAEEIEISAQIIKNHFKDQQLIFNSITRLEPPKELLFPQLIVENEGKTVPDFSLIERKSFSVVILKEDAHVFEIIVNLKLKNIASLHQAPEGSQPTFTPDECVILEKITLENPLVQEKCQALGYHDMSLVVADPWPIGYFGEELGHENRRIAQMFMYGKEHPRDNHYAHPMNFVPVFDVLSEKLIRIDEQPSHSDFGPRNDDKNLEIPKTCGNYDPKLLHEGFCRTTIKPIVISSPEGVSFQVDGNLITWENFKFRISFNQREGLVLHNISYRDGEKVRPLIYRAALSEMVVPYADPRPPFHRKCAFDVGESSLGYCVNSLKLGCDCLGAIKYFDATLNNHAGDPVHIPNAICLHEEDAGILWKHSNYRTGDVCVTRSRALVLSFIVTVVNYEYGFYWKFTQDGTISYEVKATGILSTNLVADEVVSPAYGTIVSPNVIAQYHQHIFNVRVDPMIDGQKNVVSTLDVVPLEEDVADNNNNPFGHGFKVIETKFKNNQQNSSQVSPFTSRTWKISNPNSINPVTRSPAGWKLIPNNSQTLIAKPGSKVWERAGFATNSMWVTPYKEGQVYAAGFYVNQSKGGGGLASWVDESTTQENEDVVIWHTFSLTHIPRVEDYPVMPVETCGFTLKPHNFFTSNPSLDVPPPNKNCHSQKV